jgi:hypothetical protein
MLDPSCLRQFHPVIMTPTHNHSVFYNYFLSIIELTRSAHEVGMRFDIHMTLGESLITRARNNSVAVFFEHPEWTHLIWIDADIGFKPQAVFRLLLSGYDVCAGVYPLKIEMWPDRGPPAGMGRNEFINTYARYPVNTGHADDDVVRAAIDENGFIQVREAPTGLMCIKRDVFLKMKEGHPHLRYAPDTIGVPDNGLHYRFFDVSVDPTTKRYLSEDYTFCRLWEEMGGTIHVDALSNLTHHGFKTYNGDFPATLHLNLGGAMGAAEGKRIEVSGFDHLRKFL